MSDRRRTLDAARQQAVRRLAALSDDFDAVVASSLDTNADDEHDPEGHTIAFERSQVDALVRQARGRLSEIDAALARLDAGSYGTCERCGGAIADARLAARPEARLCIGCARLGA